MGENRGSGRIHRTAFSGRNCWRVDEANRKDVIEDNRSDLCQGTGQSDDISWFSLEFRGNECTDDLLTHISNHDHCRAPLPLLLSMLEKVWKESSENRS